MVKMEIFALSTIFIGQLPELRSFGDSQLPWSRTAGPVRI